MTYETRLKVLYNPRGPYGLTTYPYISTWRLTRLIILLGLISIHFYVFPWDMSTIWIIFDYVNNFFLHIILDMMHSRFDFGWSYEFEIVFNTYVLVRWPMAHRITCTFLFCVSLVRPALYKSIHIYIVGHSCLKNLEELISSQQYSL